MPTATISMWTAVSVPASPMGLECDGCWSVCGASTQPSPGLTPLSEMLAATFRNLREEEQGYWPGFRLLIAGLCPQLSSWLLELGRWVSPFPVPQFCHLCKQGYSISLRNLCCVGEKTLDKTKEFCNFKMFKILECFDFCVLDSICRGSSGLCSHMENGMHW